jgi:uncharacterized integral membrane protein
MGVLLFVVVLVIAVVLFSVQNASPVAVVFLFWQFDASLAIIIFLSLVIGIIVGAVIALWSRRRRTRKDAQRPKDSAPREPEAASTRGF